MKANPLNITFVRANQDDISDVVEVVRRTFPHDFEREGEFDSAWCGLMFVSAITDQFELLFVAKIEERVIGFVFYQNKPPTNGEIYLNMIGIHPDFQGRGVGLQLILAADQEALRYFRDELGCRIATIHLSTSADNPLAQRLYRKAGYEERGKIIGMVGSGNVEIQMVKDVDNVGYREGLWVKGGAE